MKMLPKSLPDKSEIEDLVKKIKALIESDGGKKSAAILTEILNQNSSQNTSKNTYKNSWKNKASSLK